MEYRVVVDAMGGDNAPHEIIAGVARALKEDENLKIILVGDEQQISAELKKEQCKKDVEIVHTDEWVGMEDSPKKVLKEKKQASIILSTRIMHEGKADALVSAGNTGATVLAAAQNLQMIEGIERAGLAAIYPTARFKKGSHGVALILDVGATLKCTPKQLVHFAYMGSYYVEHVLGIENPRVALLNIGEEESKGGEVLTKTYSYLKEAENMNFIGNVEGKDIPHGLADVIVTEGFVGNITLKMMEGVSDVLKQTGKYAFRKKLTWKIGMALLAGGVKKLKARTDYSEYGGAPILGLEKLVIKAHGRSNAKAIANAIDVAKRSVAGDVTNHIADSIRKFNSQHQMDFLDI